VTPGLKERNPQSMVSGRSYAQTLSRILKVFEKTPKDAIKETVHLMNELNLGVSIEGVGE
jgi:hypothetical protein